MSVTPDVATDSQPIVDPQSATEIILMRPKPHSTFISSSRMWPVSAAGTRLTSGGYEQFCLMAYNAV
jgi:hypothetical protein